MFKHLLSLEMWWSHRIWLCPAIKLQRWIPKNGNKFQIMEKWRAWSVSDPPFRFSSNTCKYLYANILYLNAGWFSICGFFLVPIWHNESGGGHVHMNGSPAPTPKSKRYIYLFGRGFVNFRPACLSGTFFCALWNIWMNPFFAARNV